LGGLLRFLVFCQFLGLSSYDCFISVLPPPRPNAQIIGTIAIRSVQIAVTGCCANE